MRRPRRIADEERHVHFVTFSCFHRRRLLGTDRAKRIVIGTLAARLVRLNGLCLGFVVMPNHVHALVWFDEIGLLSTFMDTWKHESSARIKQLYRRRHPDYWEKVGEQDSVWQARYHSFNVYSEGKLQQKLDYVHLNPVRAGLVDHPVDWRWSSARWYWERKPVGITIKLPPGLGIAAEYSVGRV